MMHTQHFYNIVILCFLLSGEGQTQEPVVSMGAEWKLFKGIAEASNPDSAFWRFLEFDDVDWIVAQTPIQYGERAYEDAGTPLPDMQGNYTSVFLRKVVEFTDDNLPSVLEITLLNDDGAIVWLNGVELLRYISVWVSLNLTVVVSLLPNRSLHYLLK